ncbi:MAG: hypothetical protein ACK5D8_07390 [Bacteroidota bacterium]
MNISNHAPGSQNNPITCKGVQGEIEYLHRLRSPEGKPVVFNRIGSTSAGASDRLDIYEISYDGLTEPLRIYMNMYAEKKDKRAVEGFLFLTDFMKPALWEKPQYLDEVVQKEFGKQMPEWPKKYLYIHAKCGILLRMRPWVYAENDFWGYPEPQWNLDELLDCAGQVVHQLRGISQSRPVKVASVATALQFMQTMHFELKEADDSQFMKHAGKFEGLNELTEEDVEFYFSM